MFPFLRRSGLRKGEAALDWWTLVHFAAGAALGVVVSGGWVALGALVVYEFIEAGLRRIKTEEGGLFEYESWWNIVVDVAVGWLGFFLVDVFVSPFWPFEWRLL